MKCQHWGIRYSFHQEEFVLLPRTDLVFLIVMLAAKPLVVETFQCNARHAAHQANIAPSAYFYVVRAALHRLVGILWINETVGG
jgi:hypothetical protein